MKNKSVPTLTLLPNNPIYFIISVSGVSIFGVGARVGTFLVLVEIISASARRQISTYTIGETFVCDFASTIGISKWHSCCLQE